VRASGKHSAEVDGVHRIDHGLGHESFLPRSTRDPELSGPPVVLVGVCQRKACSLVRAEKSDVEVTQERTVPSGRPEKNVRARVLTAVFNALWNRVSKKSVVWLAYDLCDVVRIRK